MPKIKAQSYIKIPAGDVRRSHKNFKRGPQKKEPTPVKLYAEFDTTHHSESSHPALVFKRRFPACTWRVPAVNTPLYWFDSMMMRKKLIVSIPPDVFIVDGRRFKVIAKDHKWIGGVGLNRWLVYEEAAVPKGETP